MEAAAIPQVRKMAEESFASGLLCAESVLVAIAKAQGIDSELLPKIATGFCSGMSRTHGTCGAVSGAIMGIGLALGRSNAKSPAQPAYAATERFMQAFEHEFGSRDCHPLLDGCDLATPEGQTTYQVRELRRRCTQFTGKAAEIAARIIAEDAG